MAGEWPLETFLELGALPSAVACARWHAKELWLRSDGVRVMILVWDVNPQPPNRIEAVRKPRAGEASCRWKDSGWQCSAAACHRDRSGGAHGDRRCAADRGWPSVPGACKAASLEGCEAASLEGCEAASLERARRRRKQARCKAASHAHSLQVRSLQQGRTAPARRLPVALSGDGGPLTSPLPPCSHRPAGPVAAIGRRGRARRARSYAASVSWPMRSHA